MCGICGIWNQDGAPVERRTIDRMNATLVHRGPDGEGAWVEGEIGFGHRRLEIIEPGPLGHQPMSTPDGGLWVVFNGEIHNYLELRQDLESGGESFRSNCDTEVLLAAYRKWGVECFQRFNGMWAAAIWDARQQTLVLSRDHFGIKPLYYSIAGSRVAFASEPKAILAGLPEEQRVNREYVCWFLSGGSPDFGEDTFYQNIQAVGPSTVIVLTREGSIRPQRYWQIDPTRVASDDPEEEFRELLTDAVRMRLRSDVPVGACLSGGLDSSSIVRLAGRELDLPMECFTMRVSDPGYDESEFAAVVTAGSDAYRHHWIEPGPGNALETLAKIAWHHDGPTPARGRYGMWHVFEEVGRHVKVVVDGQGADELLAGYARHFLPFLLDSGRQGLVQMVRDARAVVRLWGRGWRGLSTKPISPVMRRFSRRVWPAHRILRRDLVAGSRAVPVEALYDTWLCPDAERPFSTHLENALWHEFRFCGLPELLHAEDAIAMAHSVEARPAFLDRRIVEFCFAQPGSEKIRDGWRKSLMRRSLEGVLPPKVQWRRDKVGYNTPMDAWLLRDQENYRQLRELMLGTDAACLEFLERGPLERLLERRRRAGRNGGYAAELASRCISLELWLRQVRQLAG
jgi:asparagine synthase (glutamine-hydrolysing)